MNGRLVFAKECGISQKKSSNPWDYFLIPNAHSKRLLFFNDITKDIYNSAFIMLLSRFKQYLEEKLEEKLGAIKYRLQEHNNKLYDRNRVPKQWAGDEISYITQHLEKLENLNKNLICLHCSITNTWQLSSACFNKDTVSGE